MCDDKINTPKWLGIGWQHILVQSQHTRIGEQPPPHGGLSSTYFQPYGLPPKALFYSDGKTVPMRCKEIN